jgi:hypothetical protein
VENIQVGRVRVNTFTDVQLKLLREDTAHWVGLRLVNIRLVPGPRKEEKDTLFLVMTGIGTGAESEKAYTAYIWEDTEEVESLVSLEVPAPVRKELDRAGVQILEVEIQEELVSGNGTTNTISLRLKTQEGVIHAAFAVSGPMDQVDEHQLCWDIEQK